MAIEHKKWIRDNIVNLVIATLLAVIGWGGNQMFLFFKEKIKSMEQWRIEDLINNQSVNQRIYKLEISDSIQTAIIYRHDLILKTLKNKTR